MRDAHGVDAQLGEYEARDKASLARRLLDRVEAVNDVSTHVEEHVRPVCREHDVDADDILTAYISARAERHTQLRNCASGRRDEAPENDDLAFAVAALDEVDDDAKRTWRLTILTAARAPFSGQSLSRSWRRDLSILMQAWMKRAPGGRRRALSEVGSFGPPAPCQRLLAVEARSRAFLRRIASGALAVAKDGA